VIDVPKSAKGQGLVEYALIIVLVVLIVIVVLVLLGPQVGGMYSNVILKV
jgi:pilus assembly protein Flp/PilA